MTRRGRPPNPERGKPDYGTKELREKKMALGLSIQEPTDPLYLLKRWGAISQDEYNAAEYVRHLRLKLYPAPTPAALDPNKIRGQADDNVNPDDNVNYNNAMRIISRCGMWEMQEFVWIVFDEQYTTWLASITSVPSEDGKTSKVICREPAPFKRFMEAIRALEAWWSTKDARKAA